jgi:hypothetical protein
MRRKKEVSPNSEKEMVIYKKKEVRRISKEKKKHIENDNKENKRNWHIFALLVDFACYFTQQDLPVKQT